MSTGGSERPRLAPRFSPAAIADYRLCPRRLWFRSVERAPIREQTSPTLVLGNGVHAALDRFFGLRPADREPAEARLHHCLRAVWPRFRKSGAFATREEEAMWGRRGLGLLSSFATHFDLGVVALSRERWVGTRLSNGAEVFGRVDRVDGSSSQTDSRIEVIDYKTGRQTLDEEDVADEPAAQVYLLATEGEYRREVSRVRFLYLGSGVDVRWEPEREDVEAVRESLVSVTSAMLADTEFEARPGEHCAHCSWAHLCPDAGRVELADLKVDENLCF